MDMFNSSVSKEEKLAAIGVNMADGLEYCAGMEEFYFEVLQEYVDTPFDEDQLKQYLDTGNLKEYRTVIHGIKSSSKTVGAGDIFARAEKLEFAARDEDMGYINEHHADFIRDYRKMISEIKAIL